MTDRTRARTLAHESIDRGDAVGWFERLYAEASRGDAVAALRRTLAPDGVLLAVARGREPHEPPGQMPWPLTRAEIEAIATDGLRRVSFEDFVDQEDPPVRRFRAAFRRQPADIA